MLRVVSLVILVGALVAFAAISPHSVPIPEEIEAPRECILVVEARNLPPGPPWCPSFARVYDCDTRTVAITQSLDLMESTICATIQVQRLVLEPGHEN